MMARRLTHCIIATALIWCSSSAAKAQKCSGVDQSFSAQQRTLFLPLIQKQAVDETGKLPKVELQSLMRLGDWYAVFALPSNAERGIYYFHMEGSSPVYKGVWGGVAAGDSARSLAESVKTSVDKNVPASLAMCMGRAVVAGR